MQPELFAAFIAGLLGGLHCLGMCGGIAGALGALPHTRLSPTRVQLSYSLGRLLSYSLAGALFGALGLVSAQTGAAFDLRLGLRVAANLMLIAMGLYISGWWLGLTRVEQLGQHLWRRLQPLAQGLLPIRSYGTALLVGMLWGWLPCGLVYSVLVWSAASLDPLHGALLMLMFGLGTLPLMLAAGLMGQRLQGWLRLPALRWGAGSLLILLGLWNLAKMLA